MTQTKRKTATLDEIMAAVVRQSGVSMAEIQGIDKHTDITRARRAFVFVAKRMTRASYPKITRAFRPTSSHSSGITAHKEALKLLESTAERDAEARRLLAELIEAVQQEVGAA